MSGGGLDLGASLYLAAKKGDSQRVRSLFAAGADLHSKPVRLLAAAAGRTYCAPHASAARAVQRGGRPLHCTPPAAATPPASILTRPRRAR